MNRSPKSEPIFNLPTIVVGFMVACVTAFAVQYVTSGTDLGISVIINFAFIPLRYSGAIMEPVWSYFLSPLSYAFLHGDITHLLINMLWLAVFGAPLAVRIGGPRFAIFWIITGAAAAAMHGAIYPESIAPLVGASGAISGMTGAAARFAFRIEPFGRFRGFAGPPLSIMQALTHKTVFAFVAIWFAMNAMIGAGVFNEPNSITSIAWQAHIGGFIAGFLLLPLFMKPERPLPDEPWSSV